MPLTRRERVRAATIDEIKTTARLQMAEHGGATLSLRAIAHEMGMTAPALYRYFASRDDLVTALIVDAYHSLAAALAATRDANHEDHAASIIASANAYRNWALAHAEEYGLIFGTPIPGYKAPMEITSPAAAKSMAVLIDVLDAGWRDGAFETDDTLSGTSDLVQAWIDKFGYEGPPAVIQFAMGCWAHIHGLVSLELFGHLTAVPGEISVDSFFETEIQAMVAQMGIA